MRVRTAVRSAPFGLRLCAYLLFGFGLTPVVLSALNGDGWGTELRLAIIPTLSMTGVFELIFWLERRRGQE
jgi:hypothetical protein